MKKFTKPIVCVLLCVAMALSMSTVAVAAGSPTFTDVPASHWAYGSIENAAANKMVNGIGGGQFVPNGTVSNSQFLTILTRAVYAQELANTKSDVSAWWGVNMKVAQNHNLTAGTEVGNAYKNGVPLLIHKNNTSPGTPWAEG